jgi:putative holliday junction resolvase
VNIPAPAGSLATSRAGTLLAFDVGTRRIGVSVGELGTATAHGIATVDVHRNGPDWRRVEALVEEWRPEGFVVGLPLAADGSETAISRLARRFAADLERRFARPVHWADERLSSDAAAAMLRGSGRRRRAAGQRDRVAAQLILETYLNDRSARK